MNRGNTISWESHDAEHLRRLEPYGTHNKTMCNLFILSLFFANFLGGVSSNASDQQPSTMLNEKPFFALRIDTSGCRFSVCLNDVPILESEKGHSITVEIPVNQYLVSKTNQLSFSLKPAGDGAVFDPEARVEVALKVRRKGESREVGANVTDMVFSMADTNAPNALGVSGSSPPGRFASRQQFRASADGDVVVADVVVTSAASTGEVKASRNVMIPLDFPAWVWLSSQPIMEIPESQAALLREYQKLWDLLKARRAEDAIKLCEAKTRELAAAFYLTPTEAREYLKIEEMLQDDDVELFKFNEEGIKMHVFGNNRLARLVSRKGQSPIVFVEKDRSAGHYIELTYCKTDKGWVIIR